MGFLDDIAGSVASNVAGSITRSAQSAASNAANSAMSGKTLAGFDVKGIVAKTKFLKLKDGDVEVYYENRKLGNFGATTMQMLKEKPPEIQRATCEEQLGRFKEEFKNKEVAKKLAEKFFQEGML